MTNKNIFLYALSCICFILLVQSCTEAELKAPSPNATSEVDWRGDCPCDNGECCCGIMVYSTYPCTLQICGDINGTLGPCTAPSGCIGSMVALSSSVVVFTALDPRETFCALLSQGLWIRNKGTTTVVFDITCLYDETATESFSDAPFVTKDKRTFGV
jgi:hypothetical protein